MKQFKRNAVIITVVLFVCVAAYLNWNYSRDSKAVDNSSVSPTPSGLDSYITPTPSSNGSLTYNPNGTSATTVNGYFDEARLSRKQARDASIETLSAVQTATGASQQIIDSALAQINAIISFNQREAELETLIKAYGFADCVVFLSEESAKVYVPCGIEGLTAVEVAQITDIVTSQTELTAANLTIQGIK